MGMQLENQCYDYEITIFHFYHFGLIITEKQFFPQRYFFHQQYPRRTSILEISCVNINKNHLWNKMYISVIELCLSMLVKKTLKNEINGIIQKKDS